MIVAMIHRGNGQAILAACDIELLGTVITGVGGLRAEINPTFFGNERVSKEDLLIMMSQATSANLFGEETVGLAVEAGYIDSECIIDIGGVPHAQLFVF